MSYITSDCIQLAYVRIANVLKIIFTKIVQDQTNQPFLYNYLLHETVLCDLKSQKKKGEC